MTSNRVTDNTVRWLSFADYLAVLYRPFLRLCWIQRGCVADLSGMVEGICSTAYGLHICRTCRVCVRLGHQLQSFFSAWQVRFHWCSSSFAYQWNVMLVMFIFWDNVGGTFDFPTRLPTQAEWTLQSAVVERPFPSHHIKPQHFAELSWVIAGGSIEQTIGEYLSARPQPWVPF